MTSRIPSTTSLRAPRGFTLIELGVVVTVLLVIVPAIYAVWERIEDAQALALAQVTAAESVRDVAEELRGDARTRMFTVPSEDHAASTGIHLSRDGKCGDVSWTVRERVLFRIADVECGGTRAFANHVERFRREGDVVLLTFALPGAPRNTDFAIGVDASRGAR